MTPELEAYLLARTAKASTAELTKLYEKVDPKIFESYKIAKTTHMCLPGTEDSARTKVFHSPSGKYTLTVYTHPQGGNFWSYTRGVVSGGCDVTICRNYSSFPYLFVEGHPDGNDYLVCGRDYQSQTVVNLTSGETRTYTSPPSFCWAAYTAGPSKTTLAVEGCYWGAPYEIIVVDFSHPMRDLPILRQEQDEFYEWVEGDADTLDLFQDGRICLLFDGKRELDLTDEEEDAAISAEDEGKEVWAPNHNNKIRWVRVK